MSEHKIQILFERMKKKFLNEFIITGDGKKKQNRIICCITAFVCGMLIALVLCLCLTNIIIARTDTSNKRAAQYIKNRAPYFATIKQDNRNMAFVTANPFNTKEKNMIADENGTVALSDVRLCGTLPRIGAWLEHNGKTNLVLIGGKLGSCTLQDVAYRKVTLAVDGKSETLFMNISGDSPSDSRTNSRVKRIKKDKKQSRLAKAGVDTSAIVPAKEGQEGSVPSELVDKLLMDPYDEMAKMRMIPAKDGGIQIARIEEDSVLGLVGVQQGDIVKSLNNIEISNLGDAANAVNSIMSGTRLDVTVMRNGKPVHLNYRVQ